MSSLIAELRKHQINRHSDAKPLSLRRPSPRENFGNARTQFMPLPRYVRKNLLSRISRPVAATTITRQCWRARDGRRLPGQLGDSTARPHALSPFPYEPDIN